MSLQPDVVLAVHEELSGSRLGAARAITHADLALAIGFRLGRKVHSRRVQEACAELAAQGAPVVALSDRGVFYAETAEEIEAALAETEKRAKRTLLRRRFLKRALLALRGQRSIPEVA